MVLVAIIKKTCEITLFFPTHQITPKKAGNSCFYLEFSLFLPYLYQYVSNNH